MRTFNLFVDDAVFKFLTIKSDVLCECKAKTRLTFRKYSI